MALAANIEGEEQAIDDQDDDVRDTGDQSDESGDEGSEDDSGEGSEADGDDDAAGKDDGEGDDQAGDDDGDLIGFGDEAGDDDEKRAAPWVRDLRKSNREKDRRIRELERQVATAAPAQKAVVVGEKPTMESCDYDAERFEKDLSEWHSRSAQAEAEQRTRSQAEEQERAKWTARTDSVKAASSALKVRDYDEAQEAFEGQFSVLQQGIIIGGPDDPKISAQLRYALGKNPKKAKELAAIQDPVKFTFAVADLMKKLTVTPRKTAPAPERVVRSSVPGAAAVDNQLAKLQEQADKTGDRSKVAAYLHKKRVG